MRSLALTCAALLLPLALVACSGGEGDEVASDPAPTGVTSTPSPTSEPTVGTYPHFEPQDYTYVLQVSCFCRDAGNATTIVVKDGAVADRKVPFPLTINDVIDAANNTGADLVTVDWPAGQDYPNSVYVDEHKDMADEEIGYAISDVVVS